MLGLCLGYCCGLACAHIIPFQDMNFVAPLLFDPYAHCSLHWFCYSCFWSALLGLMLYVLLWCVHTWHDTFHRAPCIIFRSLGHSSLFSCDLWRSTILSFFCGLHHILYIENKQKLCASMHSLIRLDVLFALHQNCGYVLPFLNPNWWFSSCPSLADYPWYLDETCWKFCKSISHKSR